MATSLDPSSTVRQLRAEVERRLGVSALHEARLCLGTEQLPADAPAARLAGPRVSVGHPRRLIDPRSVAQITTEAHGGVNPIACVACTQERARSGGAWPW